MDEETRYLYKKAAMQSSASAFAQLAGGYIDYGSLSIEANSLKTQAENVELEAKERANMLREKYNSAVGNMIFSASSRGGRSSSGSIVSNIEQSAKNLGQDISSEERNAKMKADAIRLKSKLMKQQGKEKLVTGILGSMNSTLSAVDNYNIYKRGEGNG